LSSPLSSSFSTWRKQRLLFSNHMVWVIIWKQSKIIWACPGEPNFG
jgi:hypothetical protein